MLKKINRLNKTKDIEAVMKAGRSFYSPILMLKMKVNNLGTIRLGVIVSNKVSKKATARNLIKRRIRASIKQFLPRLKFGWDGVLLASPKIIDKTGKIEAYATIKDHVFMVFKKADLL